MVSSEQNRSYFAEISQYFLVALTAVGSLLIVGWLLRYSTYGLDFTDESFYLVWIANPFIYDGSVSQFGFIYHPLYMLLRGDIAALRQANIIITFGLAWVLAYIFLESIADRFRGSRFTLLTVAAGFATSAFLLFDSWLSIPSYNSLALQALLISAIGLVMAEKTAHRTSVIGWLLIGVGGWLAFMAKPSTAVALAVGVFIYLLFSRKFSIRLLALAAASAIVLLLASAFFIDGSILRLVERVQLGLEFGEHMGGGHTLSQILRIDEFQLNQRFKLAVWLVFGSLLVALCSLWASNRKSLYIGLFTSIVFFLITAAQALGWVHRASEFGQFQGLLVFGLVYAVAVATLVLGRIRALVTIRVSQWAIACLFLSMPHIYAFGTNGNYWQAGSAAAIFWLLAGLTLLGPLFRERTSWALALPLALATQAVTATLLQTGFEQPYRQTQPLRLNVSTIEIGHQKSALVLSEGYAAYIESAVASAREAGFESTTPLIDLTGQSPGILYAMGAENIGQAWIIGGYPGSLGLAEASLSRASCKRIAASWVLFERDGPRSIPTEVMRRLGADFPGAYKRVGMWQTAVGAGGYTARRTQEFYKPIKKQETLMTCQTLRAKVAQ